MSARLLRVNPHASNSPAQGGESGSKGGEATLRGEGRGEGKSSCGVMTSGARKSNERTLAQIAARPRRESCRDGQSVHDAE